MMGIKERSFSPINGISLEELLPQENFYRRLQRTVALSFVRELLGPCYASGGRPSIDPVVFFKLQLVMFFEDIRSERQLMEVLADRLSIRWYLGYDLDEPLPDHSSLTKKIRERYGLEVFRRFFERIVELCVEAGLVRGEELFFDSTKVKANADVDSLASRFLVETHLSGLFEESSLTEGSGTEPSADIDLDALPTFEDEALIAANAAKNDWISRAGKQDRSFSSGPRKRTSDLKSEQNRPGCYPDAHGGWWGEARLPNPLRRGRWQGADNPQRLGHSLGGNREPAYARPAVEECLPLALVASSRDRRRQVRYRGERRGCRAGKHPGICSVAPERGQSRRLWQGRLHLRVEKGCLPLPSRRALAAPGQEEGW
jgi:transposase